MENIIHIESIRDALVNMLSENTTDARLTTYQKITKEHIPHLSNGSEVVLDIIWCLDAELAEGSVAVKDLEATRKNLASFVSLVKVS